MSFLSNWFKTKSVMQQSDPTKQPARHPASIDWTDNYNANWELTYGLYHNTYPGFKLAGGLAFAPIAVPVWFMGLPTVTSEDEQTQVILDELLLKFALQMQQIHTQCHREGTVWIFPHYDQKKMRLLWEMIPDHAVSDIIRDIDTGDIIKIITDEELTLSIGYNQTANVRRIRTFTAQQIDVKWTVGKGILPTNVADKTMRNPIGMIPIPFANNRDGDTVRGHSDYERIISDLKNYHDVDLAWSDFLAKFKVKMVMEVQNVKEWLENNGYATIADINISTIDLIMNLYDKEKISFAFPERAHDAYVEKLKQIFRKIVEASACPEIVWGLKTEGNRASVEESMATLHKYVHDKQDQKKEPYKKLFQASLQLLNITRMERKEPEIEVTWDELDAVSDEVRSTIFKNFAEGIAALSNAAAFTKKQLHNIWKIWYPKATEEDCEEFVKEISRMAAFKQWRDADYSTVMDLQGDENDETTPAEETIDDESGV